MKNIFYILILGLVIHSGAPVGKTQMSPTQESYSIPSATKLDATPQSPILEKEPESEMSSFLKIRKKFSSAFIFRPELIELIEENMYENQEIN